ncbi:MAG: polyketide synthase [Acidobacteriota bacterium]
MTYDHSIAIVGMSCQFPGAPDKEAFWRSVRDGRSHFRDVPADRWDHAAFYSPNPRHSESTYARKIAYLDDVRSFAPEWYGMSARRSRPMDPQQRLVLNAARLALDDAGYGGRQLPRATGVYVGASTVEYKDVVLSRLRQHQFLSGDFGQVPEGAEALVGAVVENVVPIQSYTMVGLLLNMIACNVSEAFDLHGPSLVLDAACSSSLVAVHEAVLHLRGGVCDAALAAGVYTICTPDNLVGFSRIGAVSRSDVCRPFDERADGFVLGEGVGAVVLKRLDDAVRDNDRVWAVIRGMGLNNDGGSTSPMTPLLSGQCEALARACRDADASPDTIGYIEAHGTATAVGDMTEIGALKEHARSHRQGAVNCAVASVKGNIGHTLAASGVAGLIKTVLAITHRTIPPQAGLQTVRRTLDLDGSGFYVPSAPRPFAATHALPRRAGISSFGFGGTNVHLIIEEPPQPRRGHAAVSVPQGEQPELFVVSAPTAGLLVEYLAAIAAAATETSAPVRDLAYTLTVTRRREAVRVAFLAGSYSDLRERLRTAAGVVRGECIDAMIHVGERQRDAPHDVALVLLENDSAEPDLCAELGRRFSAAAQGAGTPPDGFVLPEFLRGLGLDGPRHLDGGGNSFHPEGGSSAPARIVTLSHRAEGGAIGLLDALGELAVLGVPLILGALFEGARVVSLPSPQLRTRSFWAVTSRRESEAEDTGEPLLPAGLTPDFRPEP